MKYLFAKQKRYYGIQWTHLVQQWTVRLTSLLKACSAVQIKVWLTENKYWQIQWVVSCWLRPSLFSQRSGCILTRVQNLLNWLICLPKVWRCERAIGALCDIKNSWFPETSVETHNLSGLRYPSLSETFHNAAPSSNMCSFLCLFFCLDKA